MSYYKQYKIVESTEEALEYYYIPQHNVLIPKCSNSQRVLITLLSETHDVHSPVHVSEYPIISRKHSTYFITAPKLTVKVILTKYISTQDLAEMEEKLIKAQLKELVAKHNIDLDDL